ncbi:hypothetical protein RvY_17571 [Ramazzottius varieornatus]|uniref:Uncharacterized protein n=1 Tax=Ramazzottius varieornatus TaxID=947166 RepID=A0A1D1W3C7_RAMVA|nr:hypothetical protein RvY_17571 [Ramazzottius varieornatus]
MTHLSKLIKSSVNLDTPNGVNNIQGVAYANNIPILTPAEYGIVHREEANLIILPFFHVTDLTNVLMKFLRWRNYTYVALVQDQSDALFDAFGEEFLDLYAKYFGNTSDYTRITPIQFRRYVTTDDELRASLSYARTRARGRLFLLSHNQNRFQSLTRTDFAVFVVFAFFEQFKHMLVRSPFTSKKRSPKTQSQSNG